MKSNKEDVLGVLRVRVTEWQLSYDVCALDAQVAEDAKQPGLVTTAMERMKKAQVMIDGYKKQIETLNSSEAKTDSVNSETLANP